MEPRVFEQADAEAVDFFRANGWVMTRTLDADGSEQLRVWIDEVMAWPDDAGQWIHYREMTDDGPRLCRTENFVPYHEGIRSLLTEGPMIDAASALLGEPAVLYKEKINYKAAGGAGFSPHQDAPAYRFVETHVSCMVAIDDADAANGCLEVVSARHAEILPMDEDGCIRAEVVDSMTWETVPVPAGTTLWFHSRTPHRSGVNTSDRPRRALYPTYNALREGDLRDAYYEQKFAEFNDDAGDGSKVQVSLINDFQGRPV
jgi:hypothetical protein